MVRRILSMRPSPSYVRRRVYEVRVNLVERPLWPADRQRSNTKRNFREVKKLTASYWRVPVDFSSCTIMHNECVSRRGLFSRTITKRKPQGGEERPLGIANLKIISFAFDRNVESQVVPILTRTQSPTSTTTTPGQKKVHGGVRVTPSLHERFLALCA